MRARDGIAAFIVMIATLLALASQALAACTISTTGVNFGNYNPFAASPTDSTGSVTYRCAPKAPLTIALDGGTWGTTAQRKMKGASGDLLLYNLYKDASRTQIWGNTGGQFYSDPNPPGAGFTATIYGRINQLQDVGAGTYSDSITATINW